MEEVGPVSHILFSPNPLKLPLSTHAALHFVAYIFQKDFQRRVAGSIQSWVSSSGNLVPYLSISNGSKALLNSQPQKKDEGEKKVKDQLHKHISCNEKPEQR